MLLVVMGISFPCGFLQVLMTTPFLLPFKWLLFSPCCSPKHLHRGLNSRRLGRTAWRWRPTGGAPKLQPSPRSPMAILYSAAARSFPAPARWLTGPRVGLGSGRQSGVFLPAAQQALLRRWPPAPRYGDWGGGVVSLTSACVPVASRQRPQSCPRGPAAALLRRVGSRGGGERSFWQGLPLS